MGELHRLPTRRPKPEEPKEEPLTCGGIMHVFDEVPGTCHCGEETWDRLGLTAEQDFIGLHLAS